MLVFLSKCSSPVHITWEENSAKKPQSSAFKPEIATSDLQGQLHISSNTINCPTKCWLWVEKKNLEVFWDRLTQKSWNHLVGKDLEDWVKLLKIQIEMNAQFCEWGGFGNLSLFYFLCQNLLYFRPFKLKKGPQVIKIHNLTCNKYKFNQLYVLTFCSLREQMS